MVRPQSPPLLVAPRDEHPGVPSAHVLPGGVQEALFEPEVTEGDASTSGVLAATEVDPVGIRYEIREIRYEQCSGTPFYLLRWPFPQPLRPPAMQKPWQKPPRGFEHPQIGASRPSGLRLRQRPPAARRVDAAPGSGI